ncbi:MAG: succinate dehydrogenase/fumarate reductase iron-sulfur subunit [Chloroflexota bacterium]
MARTARLTVRRSGPPRDQAFEVEVVPHMSVLDALFRIVEDQDGTLAFRYSCRAGMCGSCAMVINGREGLACRTSLAGAGRRISVRPLRNLPVVKDLLVDMAPFFEKYAQVVPYPVQRAAEPAVIPPALRQMIDRQLDCITCGACYSACPIVASDPDFLGPAALNRASCLVEDQRDVNRAERLAALVDKDGLWRCHTTFECAAVCPKNLVPTRGIRNLKREVLRRR